MADNLTHGLAAALLAQAGFRQRYGSLATVALVVGGELPDIDALFKLIGPIAGFVHHRGITHSLLGGAVLALLAAAGLWSVRRTEPYWRLVWLSYLGVLLHIWMDYLTSYGTQLFLPFDAGRYASDTVFIVDYCYTAIMITGLLLVRMVRQQAQSRYQVAGGIWLLVGAACWGAAPHLTRLSAGGLDMPAIGLWLVLGASLALAALGGLHARGCAWRPPAGTLGVLWLLFGVGLWLCVPYGVPRPWVLMAQRNAGVTIMAAAAVVLLGTWISRHWPAPRAVLWGRLGVGALAAYVGLCAVNHAIARRQMAYTLGPQMSTVHRLSALPLPGGGPFRWRAIAETDRTYVVSYVRVLPPPVVTSPQVISKGPDNELIRDTSQHRLVQIFRDFARFPVVDYYELGTETVVRYADLRFSGDGRDRSSFDLIIHLDQAGAVRLMEFLNRIFHPYYHEF